MQIVIDIDEEYIKQIDRIRFLIGGKEDRSLQINVINAIKNGTLLPKGHGRLIDADAVFDKMQSTFDMQDLYLPIHLKELIVDEMPTIIEADKSESEDKE